MVVQETRAACMQSYRALVVSCLCFVWQYLTSVTTFGAQAASRSTQSIFSRSEASCLPLFPTGLGCHSVECLRFTDVVQALLLAVSGESATTSVSGYGYNGKLQQIKLSEFPHLQSKVYVDHAGAALYSRTQLEAIKQVSAGCTHA